MYTLNLANKEASDIKFEVSSFPDGQQQVTLTSLVDDDLVLADLDDDWDIKISARLSSFRDLELILCATASLKEYGVEKIHLYVPYFVGARSDRKFQTGGNNYLRDVICPIINAQEYKSVTVLDPHSHVLEGCLKNFRKIDNFNLVSAALTDLYVGKVDFTKEVNVNLLTDGSDFTLIAPDAGASHKVEAIAKRLGYKGEIIICSKERDAQGNIIKTVVPITEKALGKDIVIIDDICDGGRTYIEIIKSLDEERKLDDVNTHLIVTHGIFSQGIVALSPYFDSIYTTNSVNSCIEQLPKEQTWVKQLKVF